MTTDGATQSAGGPVTIFHPDRIRALAHPLRLELLEHLRTVDTATATECAEVVGESVASCSFHLRALEKYGFIERGQRRGREKPWRVLDGGTYELRPSPEQPGSCLAVAEVGSLQVARESERIQQFLRHVQDEAPEWVDASTISQSSFWATAAELRQLSDDVRDLVRRFEGRDDATRRPTGARRARLLGVVNPDPAP